MKCKSTINIGIVGCGVNSHVHANAIKKLSDVLLISCCDINEERAEDFSHRYGCFTHYKDISAMLLKEKLDAVILCTWPIQHLAQIEICFNAGIKNILCEKSLALCCAEAKKIWNIVKDKKVFLMEACMYRHHPAIRKIERILSNENIGPIDSIRAVFSNFEPDAKYSKDGKCDWRFRAECGGGVAYDWMSYCVNACNHFSGSKPKNVFATGNISPKYSVVNRVYALLEYENGTVGIIESNKSASFSQMLQITCANVILKLPVAWGIYGNVIITKEHRKEKWDYILRDSY